jgi:hypothetical protein
MTYSFKWRRLNSWFYQREKQVVGHAYIEKADKFIIRYSGGGMKEIPEWSKCEFVAGADFHIMEQEALNRQAGQAVPVAKI